MKCISCETEINPKWRHAIDINVCPFCGQHILEEQLKNLLADLAKTMTALQVYPEQLNDWLLSNHSYIKTDSPNLGMYLPKEAIKDLRKAIDEEEFDKRKQVIKVKTDRGEEEVIVEKIQSDAKTNSFFERAEALKDPPKKKGEEPEPPKSVAEKTQQYREMAKEIKRNAAKGIIPQTDLVSMMEAEKNGGEVENPEFVAELQSVISSGALVGSALPEPIAGDDDIIPGATNVVSRLANMTGNKTTAAERDMQTLQEMQNKVQNTSKKLGKGGFGRA
jgi:Zn-finger nucleic acid-binding protein